MTKRTTASADDTLPKLDMQRVRVNRDGYDSSGAYWGAGPDVFIATTADGTDEVTVRARNVADAREKVAAELARQPGAAKVSDMPIGGAAPRKTKYPAKSAGRPVPKFRRDQLSAVGALSRPLRARLSALPRAASASGTGVPRLPSPPVRLRDRPSTSTPARCRRNAGRSCH